MGKFMSSKFDSKCSQTGNSIKKGDHIYYVSGRGAFCEQSKVYQEQKEADQTADYVQANEDAYFDNFALRNNI
jgi:hypothetical protein